MFARSIRNGLNWRDEAVTPARKGLDITWSFCVVIEDLPQFFDVSIQAVFEVDEGIFRPQMIAELFAAN